jgi:hypothetical protein
VFVKLGLRYRQCPACESLYVSPRPTEHALGDYYRHSPAAVFWRDEIQRETSTTRLEKLIRPRAEWIASALAEYAPHVTAALDMSPGGGALLAELRSCWPTLQHAISIHPNAALDARFDGVEAVPHAPGNRELARADAVVAFDVLDRVSDVAQFIAEAARMVARGGLFFVAAPCASGFDLQVLGERATSIVPPDKLNILSIDGFRTLFPAGDWEVLELSTPGMFDVENVRRAIAADPAGPWPRAIRSLVMDTNDQARADLQEYLQRNRLASFARLVVRKT